MSEQPSVADEIVRFSKLRDRGVISDEDFAVQKNALLGAAEHSFIPPEHMTAAELTKLADLVDKGDLSREDLERAKPTLLWSKSSRNSLPEHRGADLRVASVPCTPSGPAAFYPDGMAIDHSRVWLIAATPILLLCVNTVLLYSGYAQSTLMAVVIALVVNGVIIRWDSHYLNQQGYDISFTLGLLFVPGYLSSRCSRLGTSRLPLVAWIMVFVLSLAGTSALDNHFAELNMSVVSKAIGSWFSRTTGTQANVVCPTKSVYSVGASFVCTASTSAGSTFVNVTVENSSGYITWTVG